MLGNQPTRKNIIKTAKYQKNDKDFAWKMIISAKLPKTFSSFKTFLLHNIGKSIPRISMYKMENLAKNS